ncbi:MAG: hypothetical protein ACI9O3_001641 [Colwellia sp.]|jgi:hypothetical protein
MLADVVDHFVTQAADFFNRRFNANKDFFEII